MPIHPRGTPFMIQHDSNAVYDTVFLSQHLEISGIQSLQIPVTGLFDLIMLSFSSWQNQEHSSGTPTS